jgi:hypothetical protein
MGLQVSIPTTSYKVGEWLTLKLKCTKDYKTSLYLATNGTGLPYFFFVKKTITYMTCAFSTKVWSCFKHIAFSFNYYFTNLARNQANKELNAIALVQNCKLSSSPQTNCKVGNSEHAVNNALLCKTHNTHVTVLEQVSPTAGPLRPTQTVAHMTWQYKGSV